MKDNKLLDLYVAYELLYETNMCEKYKDISLFPNDWYSIFNHQVKVDILMEALNKNILIINTKKYKMLKQ